MHRFTELADRATAYTLAMLGRVEAATLEALQTSAATSHIKNLQMIRLSKAILAVGMFSIFEARLQDALDEENGFKGLRALLADAGEDALASRFNDYYLAINVLKHGEGDSYRKLLAKQTSLPFMLWRSNNAGEREGDVSMVSILVDADDAFVEACADIIRAVSAVIIRQKPEALIAL